MQEGVGLIPGLGAKTPTCLMAKKQRTEEEYCNRFDKDFKNGAHPKKNFKNLKKNKESDGLFGKHLET